MEKRDLIDLNDIQPEKEFWEIPSDFPLEFLEDLPTKEDAEEIYEKLFGPTKHPSWTLEHCIGLVNVRRRKMYALYKAGESPLP